MVFVIGLAIGYCLGIGACVLIETMHKNHRELLKRKNRKH